MLSIWTKSFSDVANLEQMTKFYKELLGLTRSSVQYQWHKESEQRNSMASRMSSESGPRRSSFSIDGGRPSDRRSKGARRRSSELTTEAPPTATEDCQDGWIHVEKTKSKKIISATECDEGETRPAPRPWRKDEESDGGQSTSPNESSLAERRGSHGRSIAEDRWRPTTNKKAEVNLLPTNPWGAQPPAPAAQPGPETNTTSVKLETTNPWNPPSSTMSSEAAYIEKRVAHLAMPAQDDVWQGPETSLPPALRAQETAKASVGIPIPLPKPKPVGEAQPKSSRTREPPSPKKPIDTPFVLPVPKPKSTTPTVISPTTEAPCETGAAQEITSKSTAEIGVTSPE